MKNSLLLVLLVPTFWAYSQQQLSMQVIDAATQQGIPYVNIGIFEKQFGTVSDEQGFFTLSIPDKYLKDSLSFSSIGYQMKSFLISDLLLQANKSFKVSLVAETLVLNEVSVVSKKLKNKTEGSKILLGLMESGLSTNYEGAEIGNVISISKPSKVTAFGLQVHHISDTGNWFRLNFYNVVEEKPSEKIAIPNIIFQIPESGDFELDLNQYEIYLDGDTFVSIEFVNVATDSVQRIRSRGFIGLKDKSEYSSNNMIVIRARKSGKDINFRLASFDRWGKFDNSELGMYLKVKQ